MIYVCSLKAVTPTLDKCKAGHLVSLINAQMMPQTPHDFHPDHHLRLPINDISEPVAGLVAPATKHVDKLISFVNTIWPGNVPLVIHCWAGVSRSTAAAFITLCMKNSQTSEISIAEQLRDASPWAAPNPRLVALADARLSRNGRMIKAIKMIGRGDYSTCRDVFTMPIKL